MNKLKNYLLKLNTEVENIKEWKWNLFCLFICGLVLILISPEILWQPYIFAEDAGIYFTDAMNEGISSLGNTFGGYISVIPRIISLIALFFGKQYNSIVLVTSIMKWMSIIFVAICINYFNTKQFTWIIKNRIQRFIVVFFMLLAMCNQNFMLYSVTYTHWWGGLLVFLVSLNILYKKLPPLYIMPFLLLSVLSSPSAILIAIPIVYYFFSEIKENYKNIKLYLYTNKINIMKLILISISVLIQVYAILFLQHEIPNINNPSISLDFLFNLFINVFKSVINVVTYSITFGLARELPREVSLIIGSIIWIILIFIYTKNKNWKIIIWSILEIFLLYTMSEFKDETCYALPYYPTSWYNSINATIIIFLSANCLFYYINTNINTCIKYIVIITAIIIAVVWGIIGFKYAKRPDYSYCVNIFNVEDKIDFSSDNTIEVQNAGGKPGAFKLPIKE